MRYSLCLGVGRYGPKGSLRHEDRGTCQETDSCGSDASKEALDGGVGLEPIEEGSDQEAENERGQRHGKRGHTSARETSHFEANIGCRIDRYGTWGNL